MIEIVKVVGMKLVGARSLWLRFSDGREGLAERLPIGSDQLARGNACGGDAPPRERSLMPEIR